MKKHISLELNLVNILYLVPENKQKKAVLSKFFSKIMLYCRNITFRLRVFEKIVIILPVFLNNFVTIFKKYLTFALINGTIRDVNCKTVYFSLLFGFQKQEKIREKYHEKKCNSDNSRKDPSRNERERERLILYENRTENDPQCNFINCCSRNFCNGC